jgi:hypothetical protein
MKILAGTLQRRRAGHFAAEGERRNAPQISMGKLLMLNDLFDLLVRLGEDRVWLDGSQGAEENSAPGSARRTMTGKIANSETTVNIA